MGKIPAALIAAIAIWIAWNVYRDGPDAAFGELGHLLSAPQYGEADAPSRSGDLADRQLGDEP